MRILLIYPSISDSMKGNKFSYFIPIYPPLGLAYIAAVLEKAGYEVKIIDAKVDNLSISAILKKVAEFNPQIIGISSSTPDFCVARSLAKEIKALGNYIILIGGPHISALPEETMQEGCFDYGILGEGELTVAELVHAISQGNTQEITNIKGIIFKNGPQTVKTSPQPYIKDLDTIPFPARHLLPNVNRYSYKFYKLLPVATIITTRGCPYQCIFCDRAVFGNKLRMRSIENVLNEIEMLIEKYGVRGIDIVDDLFTVTPKRVIEFCDGLIKRKLKIAWSCMGRADCINLETLKAMKKAGCWQIAYGIESGNQRVLDTIKKNITLETIKRAVELTKKADIRTSGLFMIGLPGDNRMSMQETLEFARKLAVDRVSFCITQPFPGSELYKVALDIGELKKDIGYQYYDNNNFYKNIPYISSGLSTKLLKRYRHKFYRSFYLRPEYLFKQFINYYEFKMFPGRIMAFLKAIF